MDRFRNLLPVIQFSNTVLTRGKGTYVYDTEGNKYLDINAGQFCSIFGHSHDELSQHVYDIACNLVHTNTGMLSEDAINAADNLNRISGSMDAKSILLSTGAEAIEFCLRYAKYLKKKSGVICFSKGYHGLTLGAQSITYSGVYSFPSVPNVYNVPIPDTFAGESEVQRCVDSFESVLAQQSDNVAVAVLEPIVSVGGMIIPPKEYFNQIATLCERYGILLAFDECQTGFGRTGEWFYYQQLDCTPDIVVCAKGIGLGFPVAVVMFKQDIVPDSGFGLTHYSSHQNEPLAGAIINFGIEYIERYGILKEVAKKGEYFLQQLNRLAQQHSAISKPRGKGLMLGFDLNFEGISDYRPVFTKINALAMEKGLILQATNGGRTIRFLPSYLIDYSEIDLCISILDEIIGNNRFS